MLDVAEQSAQPTDRRDRRVYILWGVGMGLLVVLGLPCWLIAGPIRRTNGVLQEVEKSLYDPAVAYPREEYGTDRAFIERLGGEKAALSSLGLYLRLPRTLAPNRRAAVFLLRYFGKDGVSLLASALGDPKEDLPLPDPENDVRYGAAYSLAYIGPDAEAAVPQLAASLRVFQHRLNPAAAEALGKIGPAAREAIPELIRLLDEHNGDSQMAAHKALVLIGKPSVPHLIVALQDRSAQVRSWAAWTLGEIGDTRAIDPLEKLLGDESEEVQGAARRVLKALRGDGAGK